MGIGDWGLEVAAGGVRHTPSSENPLLYVPITNPYPPFFKL